MTSPIYLSEHFSFDEFTQTEHLDLLDENQAEALLHLNQLRATAEVAERVRKLLGCPLAIHSAFRCKKLNNAVGSQDNSQHLLGQAFDFHGRSIGANPAQLRATLHLIAGSAVPYHQLLIERATLHLGVFKPGQPNGEVAWWENGAKVIYKVAA